MPVLVLLVWGSGVSVFFFQGLGFFGVWGLGCVSLWVWVFLVHCLALFEFVCSGFGCSGFKGYLGVSECSGCRD